MWRILSRTRSGAMPATGHRGAPAERRCSVAGPAAVLLCLFLASPVRGEMVERMEEAVEGGARELSERFRDQIRRDVLGADALAEEYERVGFDYSLLNISGSLSTEYARRPIETVMNMISSVNASSSSDTVLPSNCCEGSSRSETCCHGCNSITEDPLLSAITDHLSSDSSLEDIRVELEYGHVDGTLLRYPTPQPPPTDQCSRQDSNLQPWYMNMIRSRPLELVLIIDLNERNGNITNINDLRTAAMAVLDSLTRQDKVQVVLVGKEVLKFVDDSGSSKVLPVCPSYLRQLKEFVRVRSPPTVPTQPAAYVDAFQTAFNFLNFDNSSDKLILFLTTISNFYVTSDDFRFFDRVVLGNISHLNGLRGNSVVISSYYNGDRGLNLERLMRLVDQPTPGTVMKLESEYDVRGYYDVFNDASNASNVQTLSVGRDVNSRGVPSLSISRSLTNGSEFLGIFRALLPWEMLFPNVDTQLESRHGSSHFFVTNDEGEVLYHPLVPGDFQSAVSVGSLESAKLLLKILTAPSSEFTVTSTKPSLTAVSLRGQERNSFISREVTVKYTCRPLETPMALLYVCVVVSSGDFQTAQLKDSKISELYRDDPDRFPLYHTSDIPKEERCFYFCSISSKDRVSVQLTMPSRPPTGVDLSDIIGFLKGDTSPSAMWAQEGVANELGVVSVVGNVWRDGMTNRSDYVVRRHLATPSGIYLAHPFAQLNPDFVPSASEWFLLSAAHPHTLTITPPRHDTLWGAGHIVSVGSALSVPPQNSDEGTGGLLAVVAADLTLLALKAFVEEAMPLCTTAGYNCFLLDDQGNLLYHELLLTSQFQPFLEEPVFFVRSQAPDIPEFRQVLISLLSESVALKMRCIDYLNQTVRQRLFFSFDLEHSAIHSVSSSGVEYAIKNVPGTNAFLGIVRKTQPINRFCFCSKTCQTCGNNERGGCECPCQCPEDCTTPHSFPPCPATLQTQDNLRSGSSVSTVNSKDDIPEFCFPQDCSCKTQENDCAASRDCHWCSELRLCRHVSECCSLLEDTASCCSKSPFLQLPSCMTSVCTADIDPPLQECVEEPRENGNDIAASIVGGVLGGFLVLILILIAIAFILWAKYCKKGLYEDEQKESNFDFSNSKPKAKNPLNDELKEESEPVAESSITQDNDLEKKGGNGTPF